MKNKQKIWQIATRITPEAERELHGYPPSLRQILFNRGYATHISARQYLQAQSPANTDPFKMTGILEAADRIGYSR